MEEDERAKMEAEIAKLRAENQDLKENKKSLRLQVSQKGAVSLYGIRRFPITFYKEEWKTMLGMADDIKIFMEEHDGELASKG